MDTRQFAPAATPEARRPQTLLFWGLLSVGVVTLFPLIFLIAGPNEAGLGIPELLVGSGAPALVFGLAAYLRAAPRQLRYDVGGGTLGVRGVFTTRRFPLAGRSARRGVAQPFSRLLGTSMAGYHAGLFTGAEGRLRIYATRLDGGVVLAEQPVLYVSPADPDAFLAALRDEGVSVAS